MNRTVRRAEKIGDAIDMSTTIKRRMPTLPGLTAVVIAFILSNGLTAPSRGEDAVTFSPECARREVQVITLIEDHGQKQDMPSDKLAAAGLKMLEARMTCYEGRVSEATKLYDSITDSLRPPASQVQR
jgi:hypothetical protein